MAHQIGVWRYASGTRNYPGYHFHADQKGCAFLLDRIQSRPKMQMSRPLTFDLVKPSREVLEVPNNGRHKALSKPKLTISINFENGNDLLDIHENDNAIALTFSSSQIERFSDGIRDVRRGVGDYCLNGVGSNSEKNQIWFWW